MPLSALSQERNMAIKVLPHWLLMGGKGNEEYSFETKDDFQLDNNMVC